MVARHWGLQHLDWKEVTWDSLTSLREFPYNCQFFLKFPFCVICLHMGDILVPNLPLERLVRPGDMIFLKFDVLFFVETYFHSGT